MTANPQVALVTGASSGIGKATAIALAAAGFQVMGTGRKTAGLTAPAGVTYLDLDVTSDESVASAVKQTIDQFGHIDVLVNNAGVGTTGAAEEFSITQTQDIFDVNVYGVMRTTKAVLPHMRAQGHGRIINVSSLSGFIPSPFMTLYVATKHAVNGYSQSLDHEVRDQGIRVLLVEPGPINTPFAGHSAQAEALAGVESGGLQPVVVIAERFGLAVFQVQFPVVGAFERLIHSLLDFGPVHAGTGEEKIVVGHRYLRNWGSGKKPRKEDV